MTRSAQVGSANFKCFRQFNGADFGALLCSRSSLKETIAERHFPSDSLQDRLVRGLAEERSVPIKEVLECFEFFHRIRKEVRAPRVADLCCGHGLLGILFALFERRVESVLLMDERQPDSFDKLLAASIRVGPWVEEKVVYRVGPISAAPGLLEAGTTIVSSHACGVLTDRCIDCAIGLQGSVAVMPCCYPRYACEAPQAVRLALGVDAAFDVDRTYRLEAAGYHVRWTHIPEQITPKNRILIGRKPQQ
jgi:hypothetical protein